jgi:hypothetical protein
MPTSRCKMLGVVLVLLGTWMGLRIAVEFILPFEPWVTDNCWLRMIGEMPFYIAVAWVHSLVGAETLPSGWVMAMEAGLLEGLAVILLVFLVWGAVALFRRRRLRPRSRFPRSWQRPQPHVPPDADPKCPPSPR